MYTILSCELKNIFYLCTHKKRRGCGEMVDTLVSGASASRRVGSTPIIRTKGRLNLVCPFYIPSDFVLWRRHLGCPLFTDCII